MVAEVNVIATVLVSSPFWKVRRSYWPEPTTTRAPIVPSLLLPPPSMSSTDPSASPLLLQDPTAPALVLSTTPPDDPPPPYPSGRRTRQNRRRRALLESSEQSHAQAPSDEYDASYGVVLPSQTQQLQDSAPDDGDASETTPLLSPNPNSPRPPLHPGMVRRQRTLSLTSTLRSSASIAPSFAHTVFSAFQPERDSDLDPECREEDVGEHEELEPELDSPGQSPIMRDYDPAQRAFAAELSGYAQRHSQRYQQQSFAARWRRYFRPLRRRAYYSALFHILVLNFPYALFSWIFLFVFTLVRIFPRCSPPMSYCAAQAYC